MVNYTVGLDFGTHQTKVCVETNEDKHTSMYSFMTFKDLEGVDQFVLPSVIQVNADDTLSYGFVDEKKCKVTEENRNMPKPKEPIKPTLVLHDEPIRPEKKKLKPGNSLSQLNSLLLQKNDIEGYEERLKSYEISHAKWKQDTRQKQEVYAKALLEYESALDIYNEKLKKWKTENKGGKKMVYRYFKQACFSDYHWKGDLSASMLSIWFLAFILFDIEDKYDKDLFHIQMGTSTNAADFKRKKERATTFLLTAYNLVENVFNGDKQAFLASTVDELLSCTKIIQCTEELKNYFGILVFPEAYANIQPIVERRKLETGMNLMVDIGGGTTDISFFTIGEYNEKAILKIVHYESLPYGLNYICEKAMPLEETFTKMPSIESEKYDENLLRETINDYTSIVKKFCVDLRLKVHKQISAKGYSNSNINNAFRGRPIVYTGGGSTYRTLRRSYSDFTDVMHMNGQLLKEFYFDDIDLIRTMYPILSAALGLAINKDRDVVELYSIEEVAAHLPSLRNDDGLSGMADDRPDYGLMDE